MGAERAAADTRERSTALVLGSILAVVLAAWSPALGLVMALVMTAGAVLWRSGAWLTALVFGAVLLTAARAYVFGL